MIPRRTAQRLAGNAARPAARAALSQQRHASTFQNDPSLTDPGMNGGYVNPPPVKRSLRDPYGDWWDKQERRNFGEPVHEDNDILGVFSTEPYRHASTGKAGFHFACFVAAMCGLISVVYANYPDKPTVPRDFPAGLDQELGGSTAVRAVATGEEMDRAKIRD